MNSGFWVLDERSNESSDPAMFVVQPGYRLKLGDSMYFKHAVAWYDFLNVRGTTLDNSAESNTLTRDGVLRYLTDKGYAPAKNVTCP